MGSFNEMNLKNSVLLLLLFLLVNFSSSVFPTTCGTISSAGGYTLTQNLSSTGSGGDNPQTCINVTISNVTIDCQGFSVSTIATNNDGHKGIAINSSNVTVKNCFFNNYNASGAYAVYVNYTSSPAINNITIYNSTILNPGNAVYLNNVTNSNFSALIVLGIAVTSNAFVLDVNGIYNSTFSNLFFNLIQAGSIGINSLKADNVTFSNLAAFIYDGGLSTFYVSEGNSNASFNNATVSHSGNTGYVANIASGSANFTNSTLETTQVSVQNLYCTGGTLNIFTSTLSSLDAAVRTSCSTYVYDLVFQSGNLTLENTGNATLFNSSIDARNVTGISDSSSNAYVIQPINVSTSINTNVTITNYSYQTLNTMNRHALFNVTALRFNSSGTFNFTNLVVNASNASFSNQSVVGINAPFNGNYQNAILQLFAFDSCSVISSPGTYNITANISVASSTCLSVTAQNVTINCQGFYFNSNNINSQYAVYTTAINTTIKNCKFANFIQNSTSYSVYSTASNLTVYNSTFYNFSGGVYSSGSFANASNNFFNLSNSTSSSYVIFLSGNNSTVAHNTILNISSTDQLTRPVAYVGGYSTAYNNTIYGFNAVHGILASAAALNISNNSIYNVTYGIYGDSNGVDSVIRYNLMANCSLECIRVYGRNVTVYNNTIESSVNFYGVLTFGNYSNVSYNVLTGPGYGVSFEKSGVANSNGYFGTLSYNFINVSGFYGLNIAANSSAYQNTIINIGNRGINLQNSNYSRIFNNTIANSTNNGIIAIFVDRSNHTDVFYNDIYNFSGSSTEGLYLLNSISVTVFNSNFSNSTTPFTLLTSSNVTVVNSSFTTSAVSVAAGSQLYVQTPVNVSVVNSSGSLIASVQVNLTNGSTVLVNSSSDVNGNLLSNVTVLLYNGSNTPINYSNVTIWGFKAGFTSNYTYALLPNGVLANYLQVSLLLPIELNSPSVTFVFISNNSNLSGVKVLNATITDESAIHTVLFNVSNTSGQQSLLVASNTSNSNWNASLNTPALQDGEYNITVIANDTLNNRNETTYVAIRIDNTNLNITNVSTSVSTTSAVIIWNTSELANSSISYGTVSNALNSNSTNASNSTTHSASLSGLAASTTYYFNVTSCDLASNCNTSGPHNFTTSSAAVESSSSSGGGGGGGAGVSAASSNASNASIASTVSSVLLSRDFLLSYEIGNSTSTMRLEFTPRGNGFSGDLVWVLPLNYGDYLGGKVKFTPAPNSVEPGSIKLTYKDVSVPVNGKFTVVVKTSFKIQENVIKSFVSPVLKTSVPSAATGKVTQKVQKEVIDEQVQNALVDKKENTWLYALVALIVIAVVAGLYFKRNFEKENSRS